MSIQSEMSSGGNSTPHCLSSAFETLLSWAQAPCQLHMRRVLTFYQVEAAQLRQRAGAGVTSRAVLMSSGAKAWKKRLMSTAWENL